MNNDKYKVVKDNLGEYTVLRPDNTFVATEIQFKVIAELFCEELNELNDENKELKHRISEAACMEFQMLNRDIELLQREKEKLKLSILRLMYISEDKIVIEKWEKLCDVVYNEFNERLESGEVDL